MESTLKIKELVSYNLWANKRLVQWLKNNNQELLVKECASSFPNIHKTLHHILEGQLFYYAVLNQIPYKNPWGNTLEGSYTGLIEQSTTFSNYAESQQHFNDLSEISIRNIQGEFPKHELISHCMNHSTYHRGQIITMGHQLGMTKAPSTDLLFYYIKRKQ